MDLLSWDVVCLHRCHFGHKKHAEEHANTDNKEHPDSSSYASICQGQRPESIENQLVVFILEH